MAWNATPRTLFASAVSGLLVIGLAACGGDDDDAGGSGGADVTLPDDVEDALDDVTIPAVTLPDVTIPDLSDVTLPGGITIPDFSIPDFSIPDFSIPDFSIPDVAFPDMSDVTAPEFSGEGAAEFCEQVANLESQFEDVGTDPEDYEAMIEAFDQIQAIAPPEISGDLEILKGAFADIAEQSEAIAEEYGPDSTDPEAMNAAMELMFGLFAKPEVVQASVNMEAYDEQFCQS